MSEQRRCSQATVLAALAGDENAIREVLGDVRQQALARARNLPSLLSREDAANEVASHIWQKAFLEDWYDPTRDWWPWAETAIGRKLSELAYKRKWSATRLYSKDTQGSDKGCVFAAWAHTVDSRNRRQAAERDELLTIPDPAIPDPARHSETVELARGIGAILALTLRPGWMLAFLKDDIQLPINDAGIARMCHVSDVTVRTWRMKAKRQGALLSLGVSLGAPECLVVPASECHEECTADERKQFFKAVLDYFSDRSWGWTGECYDALASRLYFRAWGEGKDTRLQQRRGR